MKKSQNCWLLCRYSLLKMIKIMRFTIFILLISITQTFASPSYAQQTKLSLNFKGVAIEKILDEIENNSEFYFLYNKKLVDVERIVTVEIKEQPVVKVMDVLFNESEVSYSIVDRQILLTNKNVMSDIKYRSVDQKKEITGKVSDSFGEPLPGVTVVIKGTTTGSVTNANGEFKISQVSNEDILQFSFVGMLTQEIQVGMSADINVTMVVDAIGIEEVVAIGYGTQKKANLTGAVETIQVEGIKSRPLTNASLALQGKVAGAFISQNSGQPGNDDATILIRGLGTFNNSSPLVIIDGMEGNINDVNPKDIETVSVLKDAASTAIYGNRAANGVILVTTKRGSTDRLQVDYTGYYGVQKVTTMPDLLKGVEYLELMALAHYNTNKDWPSWYNDEYMAPYRNNTDPNRYPTDFDWVSAVFSPAPIIDNHVNVSGGNDVFQFSASVGYLDQDGVVDGNSSKKLSFRTNLSSYFLDKRLKVDINMSGNDKITDDLVQGMNTAMYFVYVSPSTTPMKIPGYGYTTNAYNWAATEAGGYRKTKESPINVRMAANYKLMDGLDLSASYGLYRWSKELEIFAPKVYLYGYQPDGSVLGTLSTESTGLDYTREESLTKVFNSQINYNRELFDKFEMSLMGGGESREYRYDRIWAKRENFSVNLPEFSIGDPNSQKNDGGAYDGAWLSYFGRINFNYAGKYLIESNIRRDGSSRFLDKWGTFPSVSVGWRVSAEPFVKDNISAISNLKLRGSWGRLGNESIGQYYAASDELSLSLATNFGNTLYPAAAITKLANKKTSWETSEQLNFGADFGIMENKFVGTIDYYIKKNFDILMQIPVSGTLGLTTLPYQNVAEMQNRGLELQLSYNGKFRGLKINANLAAAHTKNEITDLAGQEEIIFRNLIWKEGEAYNSFYGFATEGIYQSQTEIESHLKFKDENGVDINPYAGLIPEPGDIKFTDQNGDGIINEDDKTILGKPFPDWTFSTTLNLEWKNFDLSMFFQGVAGVNSLNQFMVTAPFHGGGAGTGAWYRDGWTDENPSETIQRVNSDPTRFEIVSDYYLEDASYIRLKNIELGYSLPKSVLSKLGISSVRVFANIQNALTWTKMRYGFDPEKPSTITTTLQYPQTRIVSTGINLKF